MKDQESVPLLDILLIEEYITSIILMDKPGVTCVAVRRGDLILI